MIYIIVYYCIADYLHKYQVRDNRQASHGQAAAG